MRTLTILAALTLFLSGCGVKNDIAAIDTEVDSLISLKGRLLEKRQLYERQGVFAGDQCRLIDRGQEPLFACGSPKNKAIVSAAVCGTRGVQLCRNLVANSINDQLGSFWGGLANIVANAYREDTGFSLCGGFVAKAMAQFSESESVDLAQLTSFATTASTDPYAIEALEKCDGIICKQMDSTAQYTRDEIGEKIISSTTSCVVEVMKGCQRRYTDWAELPERLRNECDVIRNDIRDAESRISVQMAHLNRIQNSIEYKLLKLVGAV